MRKYGKDKSEQLCEMGGEDYLDLLPLVNYKLSLFYEKKFFMSYN